ncbi:MAG: hypothetical protein ACRD0C_22800, partial [Acidimicrobiia bacterium]
ATCSDGSPVDAIVLGEGEVVTCTFTDEALPPPPPPGGGYDTYDDDPGDPGFDFDSPFDDAGAGPVGTVADTGDDPATDVAGTDLTANSPETASAPAADAGMTDVGGVDQSWSDEADTGAVLDPAVLPQALSHLPRTGMAIDQAIGLGLLLMAVGVVILLLRPRRQDEYSS